jgi:hypothetical protein
MTTFGRVSQGAALVVALAFPAAAQSQNNAGHDHASTGGKVLMSSRIEWRARG